MKSAVWCLAAVGAAYAAGCALAADAPYQSKMAGGGVGYAQERLDDTHWLVKYVGDQETSQQTVETYLLYRAAELTLKKGGDWFETSDNATSLKKVIPDRNKPASGTGLDYGWGSRPHWQYYNVDRVARERTGIPGQTTVPIRGPSPPLTRRFVATAEIVIGKGPPPEGRRVFDARQLIAQLEPSMKRPAVDRPAE